MTAKPINPSFEEFSEDDPILRGSRTHYRQKLLRKSPKASVSSELTRIKMSIIPVFTANGSQAHRLVAGTRKVKGAGTAARGGILRLLM
jgi:hypothetical protein